MKSRVCNYLEIVISDFDDNYDAGDVLNLKLKCSACMYQFFSLIWR